MKLLLRTLPWALLVASVAFNFAFILHRSGGGSPTTSAPAPTTGAARPTQPADDFATRFERRLGLTEEQKRDFVKLRLQTREKARDLRQKMTAVRRELLDLMANDSADPKKIDELIRKDAELGRQLRVLDMEHNVQLMRMLTPEQRKKLLEILHRRELTPPHGFGPGPFPTSHPFMSPYPSSRPFPGAASRPADSDRSHRWSERWGPRDSRPDAPAHEPREPASKPTDH